MRRWHEDYKISFREWKKYYNREIKYQHEWGIQFGYELGHIKEIGRFRKKDAYDCGIPRCKICHYEKFYQKRSSTYQEWCSDLKMKEGLAELNGQID